MVSTARMARSRTPYFRCGTSRKSYQNTGNALFTGPFYYTNPCIKIVVLIDSAWHKGCILKDMYDYLASVAVVANFATTAESWDGGSGHVPYRGFRECQKCKAFRIDEPDIISKKALFWKCDSPPETANKPHIKCKNSALDKFPQTKNCLDKFPRTGSGYPANLTLKSRYRATWRPWLCWRGQPSKSKRFRRFELDM